MDDEMQGASRAIPKLRVSSRAGGVAGARDHDLLLDLQGVVDRARRVDVRLPGARHQPGFAVVHRLRRLRGRAVRAVLDAALRPVGVLVRGRDGRHLRDDGRRRAARRASTSLTPRRPCSRRCAGRGLHHVAAVEHTLSVHSIDTPRRELFYWAAVVSTFALGTAVGDLTAITLNLGYLGSVRLFATLIPIPAIGYWRFDLTRSSRSGRRTS